MDRIVLLALAIVLAAFGVASLVAPAAMMNVVGIALANPASFAEIRAMYGGSQIGLAAFFFFAHRDEALRRPALFAVAFLMGGFAMGRLCGIALDASYQRVTLVSLAVEAILCAVALVALRREPLTRPG